MCWPVQLLSNMATLGHIDEFDVASPSTWDPYTDSLDCYLETNKITDGNQKYAVLLNVIGSKFWDYLLTYILAKPHSKTYHQILKLK